MWATLRFSSPAPLAAHRRGRRELADWYATYMVREQAGAELPL
ncbi:hypothetical protein [Streptomyces sp. NPDC001530]